MLSCCLLHSDSHTHTNMRLYVCIHALDATLLLPIQHFIVVFPVRYTKGTRCSSKNAWLSTHWRI